MRAFARKIIFFYVFSRILRVYILPEYFHGNWVLNKFDTRLRQLFDESYLLADFLCCCIFFLVELNFLLLEPVVTLCIYRYDKWAKLFHTAVPECLRHSEISPLSSYDLFNLCCCLLLHFLPGIRSEWHRTLYMHALYSLSYHLFR